MICTTVFIRSLLLTNQRLCHRLSLIPHMLPFFFHPIKPENVLWSVPAKHLHALPINTWLPAKAKPYFLICSGAVPLLSSTVQQYSYGIFFDISHLNFCIEICFNRDHLTHTFPFPSSLLFSSQRSTPTIDSAYSPSFLFLSRSTIN